MIREALETRADGVLLSVKAHAGGRKNELRGVQAGMLKLSVTQIAERGKANQAIAELLCDALELRRSQVSLVTGETSPAKRFLVREMTADELARRIESALS